jgi:hypothetical protein
VGVKAMHAGYITLLLIPSHRGRGKRYKQIPRSLLRGGSLGISSGKIGSFDMMVNLIRFAWLTIRLHQVTNGCHEYYVEK